MKDSIITLKMKPSFKNHIDAAASFYNMPTATFVVMAINDKLYSMPKSFKPPVVQRTPEEHRQAYIDLWLTLSRDDVLNQADYLALSGEEQENFWELYNTTNG